MPAGSEIAGLDEASRRSGGDNLPCRYQARRRSADRRRRPRPRRGGSRAQRSTGAGAGVQRRRPDCLAGRLLPSRHWLARHRPDVSARKGQMDDQLKTELEAAAFRGTGRAPAAPHRCTEHRPDESGRLLPQLPVEMVRGGGGGARRDDDLRRGARGRLRYAVCRVEGAHQVEASAEQQRLFEETKPLHAVIAGH